eukprot:CAMPEP_0194102616 /NCGR_PEP_ID=MMETSP0150-20130528/3214_1 /TAXON_ID=122233 /ORGANISM="Chaetoceros debilis, Strain MM31A-1" /LENGTH=279 /DNA_ID=CAMNT_0038789633 /DNA_START=497 /DNA_END=1337 /DNA_ORIENTATION=+
MGNTILGDPDEGSFGNSLALSADGEHIAIGSERYDKYLGRVNVYTFTERDWLQLGQSLLGKCRQCNTGWGLSLSHNGETIAIGAYDGSKGTDDDSIATSDVGYTTIYKYNAKQKKWKQLGQKIFGETPDEEDGTSVDLSGNGNTVINGGLNFGKGSLDGRARVLRLVIEIVDSKVERTWKQDGNDLVGEVGGGRYGISVSMSENGSIITVGGAGDWWDKDSAGYVDVFKLKSRNTKWRKLGNRIIPDPQDKNFGQAASLLNDGETVEKEDVAIGANDDD